MGTTLKVLATFLFVATAAVSQTALAGNVVVKEGEYVDYVYASWNSSDGCGWYEVTVSGVGPSDKPNSPASGTANIFIYTDNQCTGFYGIGSGQAEPGWSQVDIKNNLQTASLKGNIPIRWMSYNDWTEFQGNAALDLQWTSSGKNIGYSSYGPTAPERTTTWTKVQTLSGSTTSRVTGNSVAATISGSLSFDGNPCALPPTDQGPVGIISKEVSWSSTTYQHVNPPKTQ